MGAKLWPAAEWRATMLSRYELGLVARGQRPCAVVSPAARRARSHPWMLEVLAVELQLGVGRNEVLARPFVLPGGMPPAPDVSEPLAAPVFSTPFSKVKNSLFLSTSPGLGLPTSRHTSMKHMKHGICSSRYTKRRIHTCWRCHGACHTIGPDVPLPLWTLWCAQSRTRRNRWSAG